MAPKRVAERFASQFSMSLRVWVPWHPSPVPVAGTCVSSFVSLTAHAALLAVVVGSDGFASARSGADVRPLRGVAPTASDGERLHWVGVDGGGGTDSSGTRSRRGAPPPLAYVVPGRGGPRYRVLREPGRRDRLPGLASRDRTRGAGVRAEPSPAPVPPPSSVPPRQRLRRVPLPALPDVTMPDPEATLLVAGVISAAPDLARRVSRPEDFATETASDDMGEPIARTSILSRLLLQSNVRVDALPIPLVSNPPPAYPDSLERAGVGGRVVVEFMIDSMGTVDMASLRVVQSTNALFTQAVRHVLPQLRFLPAQLEERAIGVTVRQPFLFRIRTVR